ncbi:MAG TPA: Nif3-like dinuclear metal center hexameric protein, partial [Ottowia sp.]|nr:Nif3-like dinuclear metal center hexameric protein [Ottowia sp.]
MSALLPTVDRAALLAACNAELRPEQFKDYGPNGLQVEGRPRIRRI